MTFADLASGARVFLDANPLVYYFGAHPLFGPASKELVERIEKHDVLTFTSTHVLSEAAHHLMTLEAASGFALLFWLVSFVIIVPVGLALAFREGLRLSSLREMGEKATSD